MNPKVKQTVSSLKHCQLVEQLTSSTCALLHWIDKNGLVLPNHMRPKAANNLVSVSRS
jgi:hypothetical protein